ncbi:hypothetical protein AOQ84DRAFT_75886 [Glonium stellatum]|uniref:Uncharacterized protein n=1 Tax=Glonium stellatum TaxID=574774 RepID=A0A8E2JYL9_9PEZI|nr:hypothetical protein AOQ84DRAFT_75886 [Glonium stellatum]
MGSRLSLVGWWSVCRLSGVIRRWFVVVRRSSFIVRRWSFIVRPSLSSAFRLASYLASPHLTPSRLVAWHGMLSCESRPLTSPRWARSTLFAHPLYLFPSSTFRGVQNREHGAATLRICIGTRGTQKKPEPCFIFHRFCFYPAVIPLSLFPSYSHENLAGYSEKKNPNITQSIGRAGYQKSFEEKKNFNTYFSIFASRFGFSLVSIISSCALRAYKKGREREREGEAEGRKGLHNHAMQYPQLHPNNRTVLPTILLIRRENVSPLPPSCSPLSLSLQDSGKPMLAAPASK